LRRDSPDQSATSRRFAVAVQLDYLRNMEERKGRTVRVRQRDLMRDKTRVLPEAKGGVALFGEGSTRLPPNIVGGLTEIPS
jgi:hypothetical protein